MKTLIATCLLIAGCQSAPSGMYNPELAAFGQRLQMAGAHLSAAEQQFQPPQIVPMAPMYQPQPGSALMGNGGRLLCARMPSQC